MNLDMASATPEQIAAIESMIDVPELTSKQTAWLAYKARMKRGAPQPAPEAEDPNYRHPVPTFAHRIELEPVYHGFQYRIIGQAVFIACKLIGAQYDDDRRAAQERTFIRRRSEAMS